MAPLSKAELLDRVAQAINVSGWNVLYLSSRDSHPFELQIYHDAESYRMRIYIWNLTHGGGAARPANEYRIQITGVNSFEQTPSFKTLILGWWQDAEVFAGFDVRKHASSLGSSPSFQIRKECLEQAALNAFSPCDKGNQEIAIAFRPDFFVEYVRNLTALHDFGQSNHDLAILDAIAQNPEVNDSAIEITDNARRTTVVSVSKKLRSVNFRRRVLMAYQSRCAVCGLQLRLIDAAHIIPVYHENSRDEIRNGLALCALHHRAYDQSLITVWDDYTIRINDSLIDQLRVIDEVDGLDSFHAGLLSAIRFSETLPVADRPHVEYIRIANHVRGWS